MWPSSVLPHHTSAVIRHCEGCQHSAPKNDTEVEPKQMQTFSASPLFSASPPLFLKGTSRKMTSRSLLRREHMGAPHTCAESAKTNLSTVHLCAPTQCAFQTPLMHQLRMPLRKTRPCRNCGCRNCGCQNFKQHAERGLSRNVSSRRGVPLLSFVARSRQQNQPQLRLGLLPISAQSYRPHWRCK